MANALLVFVVMVAIFIVCMRFFKMPTTLAMTFGAIAGAVTAGLGVPIRRLAEGSTAYISFLLIVVSAAIFMDVLKESGG